VVVIPLKKKDLWSLEIKEFNVNILGRLFQAKQTIYWKEIAETSLSELPQLSEVRWMHWHMTAHICTSMMPNRWSAAWTSQSWWNNMEEVGYIILKHIITQRTECYKHTHTQKQVLVWLFLPLSVDFKREQFNNLLCYTIKMFKYTKNKPTMYFVTFFFS